MEKATLSVPRPSGGMIGNYAQTLIDLRDLCAARMRLGYMFLEVEVTGTFSGIAIICDKNSTVTSISARYNTDHDRRYQATHHAEPQPAAL